MPMHIGEIMTYQNQALAVGVRANVFMKMLTKEEIKM